MNSALYVDLGVSDIIPYRGNGCVIPCPGRVQFQKGTHDIVELCLTVCRLYEWIEEHVWKIRMLFILHILSQVVISHICFTNFDFDMAPRHLHPACQSMG